MYKERLKKFKNDIIAQGLDGFLIMKPENRRYLSGFTGSAGMLLITKKHNFLLADFRYIEQAQNQAPDFQVIKYGTPMVTDLYNLLERLPVEVLGFEGNYVTFSLYQELSSSLNVKLEEHNGLVEKIRMIKTKEELQLISKAAEIADNAFSYIIDKIKPGMTENEIAFKMETFMRSQGASALSFTTIAASGKRSALPHGIATDKKLQLGDFLTLDFGCIYQGYCSDMTRTLVLGKPDEKQRRIYDIVLKAQQAALEQVKAGLTASEVDKISRDIIAQNGLAQFFGHGLGHALGLEVHEKPSLNPNDMTVLSENMVITIEPGIYLPDWGGVRIEDLIIVTNEGHQNLTRSSKELLII